MKQQTKTKPEGAKLVQGLLGSMKPEIIALKLRVSLATVYRWKRGITPQPSHMEDLRALAASRKRTNVQ